MMMEKLNKKKDVSPVVILRNMVDKEDIDESLEEEVAYLPRQLPNLWHSIY